MKLKHILWIFIVFPWILQSCTDPFNPGITDYEQILVVEGMITDQPGPYRVTLSRTTPVHSEEVIHESGALVRISDDLGNEAVLNETSPGVYQSDREDIQGVAGRTYTLHIHTDNGHTFESEPVVLRPVPGIDSIYTTYRESYSFEYSQILPGIQINVDTKPWDPEESYFLKWDYQETWQVYPKWASKAFGYEPCWNIEYNSSVLVESTSQYTTNRLTEFPLTQYSNKSYKLFEGYSILVTQYSLNQSAYQFWRMLEESSQDNGSVFDNVPYNPQSNIYSSDDKEARVFGYFDAAGVDRKRAYFEPPIHGLDFTNYYSYCDCNYYVTKSPLYYNSTKPEYSYVIWEDATDDLAYTFNRKCLDCSVFTTTTEKPAFWNYN